MTDLILTDGLIVNEGRIEAADLLIRKGRIEQIGGAIDARGAETISVAGCWVLPGMIDDQVHFREPGLTHKGDLTSESRAAVAGGITSFMDMPNNKPPILTAQGMEEKVALAEGRCHANYGFYFGASNDNIEEIKRLRPGDACGLKVFMGASTGNMLVDDEAVLEAIFANAQLLVATHCEDTPMILAAEKVARERFGDDVPMSEHPTIRSAEACWASSSLAVDLAKKHGTRLHVLHITTARELDLFSAGEAREKRITAEACVHHLWFSQEDYTQLGAKIKCNPAIKRPEDRDAILNAVREGVIDIIATDHAPHTIEEKNRDYFGAPAGLPLVQEALLTLMQHHKNGVFELPLIVEKTAHAVADLFGLRDRGYLREGYWADIVVVDPNETTEVVDHRAYARVGWSPFAGVTFDSKIRMTLVNGKIAFQDGSVSKEPLGRRLDFEPDYP